MTKYKIVKTFKVAPLLKGLKWKRKGRMMGKQQFYGSNLHFHSEASYDEYRKSYKVKYKKRK